MVDYGWGFRVNDGGSVETTKDGKIETVDDKENLGQQISLRLRSPRGSHPFDPEFGLDMVGIQTYKKLYRSLREAVAHSIFDCLTKKPEVKDIDFITVDFKENREWLVDAKVITLDGDEVHFSTVIEENADIRNVISNVFDS